MRAYSTVRRVAERVVTTLRDPSSDEARQGLARLKLQDWQSGYHWLDANGLTLYFRDVIRANQLDTCIPSEVLARFDQNYSDNRSRLQHQLVEFRQINQHFQDAGIRYTNLKGFTLEPAYCRDLSLRYQCDLDFMVRRADGPACRTLLATLGYRLTSEQPDTLEFKPREDRLPDIADLYKPRKQHAIEIHFDSPEQRTDIQADSLDRVVWNDRFDIHFPALSGVDMFFALVFHLYRHLLSEWVRMSWFYELDSRLQGRRSDDAFWRAVSDRADIHPETSQALALVIAFSKQAFSRSIPEPLSTICSRNLSNSAQRWVLHYGPEMLYSDFPGNKLYLLLLQELILAPSNLQTFTRKRLLPFHAPARALYGNSLLEQLRHIPGNTQYQLSRTVFHAREGLRYLKERWRWKRHTSQAARLESVSE